MSKNITQLTMFDAFNWAVNKEIINKMEEGLYTL